MSISCKTDGTAELYVPCFAMSCWLPSFVYFGSALRSVEIYMGYMCVMGKHPSQTCGCFLSLLIFASNQFETWARSVSERLPTYGTSSLSIFFFFSYSQAFASTYSDFMVAGASKICCRIASKGTNALWICWLYETDEGSMRISSDVGISQECFHFPSWVILVFFVKAYKTWTYPDFSSFCPIIPERVDNIPLVDCCYCVWNNSWTHKFASPPPPYPISPILFLKKEPHRIPEDAMSC